MRDADQPRAQRPAVGLAQRPLEVAVGLQEGLLGQVLGVVMVADPVVGVGVDVAQVRPVELGELRVELGLVHARTYSAHRSLGPRRLQRAAARGTRAA